MAHDGNATWSMVDARGPWVDGVDAGTRVAGLSLIARHVRLAGRCGLAGVMICVEDEHHRAALEAALARQPPPPGLAIEYLTDAAPADRAAVPVQLFAVYTVAAMREATANGPASGAAPAPLVTITSRADLRTAEARLFASIRKNIDQDGVLAYYTQRPIARPLTRLLIDTPVSPNHVSLTAMACGLTAAVCAGMGGYALVAVAGVLYWLGAVIDCIDGDLARLRLQGSKLGEWLDTLADDVSTYGLIAGLCAGMLRDGQAQPWAYFGLIAGGLGVLAQIKLYADLHRMGGTFDTAQYPWFFGKPSEGAGDRGSLIGRLFYGISFLFRRDAVVTMIGVLLLLGLRAAAVAILGAGVAIVVVLLAVHLVVTASRRPAAPT